MALHYFFAPTPRQVFENCADRIHEEATSTGDPFHRPLVVVPHAQAASHLRRVYTERHGIAMNIGTSFLEEALWELWNMEAPHDKEQRRLTRDHLQAVVLHLLHEELHSGKCPAPLRDYLAGSPPESPVYSKKLWQLTNRLAFLFLEYSYQYPNVTNQWAMGRGNANNPVDEWQAALYFKAFAPDGPIHTDGVPHRFLPDFSQLPRGVRLPEFFRLLLPGNMSRLHLGTLAQLDQRLNVIVHTLFPGNEPGGVPERLQSWTVPAEISIKLQDEVFKNHKKRVVREFTPFRRKASTMLEEVKCAITGSTPDPKILKDLSIEIAGAAGVLREVQAVHQSILHRMLEDRTLLQTDIALMIPGEGEYEAAVHSVFSAARSPLRASVVRANAFRESVYALGTLALMNLLQGDFNRSDVFTLFQNPCFQEAVGCTTDDVLSWMEDVDRAGIYRHADHIHQEDEDPRGNGRFTWEHGLRRMRLGHVMDLDEEEMDAEYLFPIPREAQFHPNNAASLSIIIGRLVTARRYLAEPHRTLAEWADILRQLLATLLAIPDTHPEEWAIRNRLDRRLQGLSGNLPGHEDGHPFHLLRCLVEETLGTMPVRKGIPMYGGVTVGTLETLRGIPFRVIYVLGLNSGSFPARRIESSLDIRSRIDRGCRITQTDRDRQNFLEAIFAAEEALVLTYQSRNLKKDEELFPSSVVLQLVDFVMDKLSIRLVPEELPWHGHSRRYLIDRIEPSTLHSNYDLLDRAIINAPAAEAPPDAKPVKAKPSTVGFSTSVNIRELATFLEDPLKDFLQRRLNIRGLDDSKAERLTAREPFELSPLNESMVVRSILRRILETPDLTDSDVEELIQRAVDRLEGESAIYDGVYLDRIRARLMENIPAQATWLRSWLQGHQGENRRLVIPFGFGSTSSGGRVATPYPPISYTLGKIRLTIQIRGDLPVAIFPGARGEAIEFLALKPISKFSKGVKPVYFPGILTAIFLVAARQENHWIKDLVPPSVRFVQWCLYRGGDGNIAHNVDIHLDRKVARDLADKILHEFLLANTPELMPYALVGDKKYIPGGEEDHVRLLGEDVMDMAREDQESLWRNWYPDEWSLVVDSLPPKDVEGTLERRLGFIHHLGRDI